MRAEDVLKELMAQIRAQIPPSIEITELRFEGPRLVVYTKNPDLFTEGDLVGQLAKSLRKRITIRPDPSIVTDVDMATTKIEHIVPPEAEVTDVFFDTSSGEVTIEASKPGLVIGRHATTLEDIKRSTGWVPKVMRTPPIRSNTVADIRSYLRANSEERRNVLEKVGRKIHGGTVMKEFWARITSLGGFREVGRSCILVTTPNSKVMLDCGLDVSSDRVPYLYAPEVYPIDSIDAVVITHAHFDHSGLVPLLYKYGYEGPVYCTPPTRELMTLLQLDYLKVTASEAKKAPYESTYIREVIKHCIPLAYGETTDITPDIKLTLHNAGHILGSAVAHLHLGGGAHNVAYTGDFKYERTWLFDSAINSFPRVETLIMESTYGGAQDFQPSRGDASEQLGDIVGRTLTKKGKVLIPVFAVGRSQEVMLVLENLMANGDIPRVPVYLDGMMWEATAIHTTYPEYLNRQLSGQIFRHGENPFLSDIFHRVDSSDARNRILDDPDPCVVLATSGMLNGGPVMEYLRVWGPESQNTIVFVGYQAEGTLGRKIQRGWQEIPLSNRGKMNNVTKIAMNVETCDGFSGHSDRRQLLGYVHGLNPRPQRVITCHGDVSKCIGLATTIYKKYGIETRAMANLETTRLV